MFRSVVADAGVAASSFSLKLVNSTHSVAEKNALLSLYDLFVEQQNRRGAAESAAVTPVSRQPNSRGWNSSRHQKTKMIGGQFKSYKKNNNFNHKEARVSVDLLHASDPNR